MWSSMSGDLTWDYDGKRKVIVYDYVDSHIPKFDKMYSARLKAYKKIGYELCVNMDGEKQKANAIYDIENYAETYWKDLEEANSAVVVSSPRLNNQKVDRIINMLGKRRELGVEVTIVQARMPINMAKMMSGWSLWRDFEKPVLKSGL